MLSIRPGRVPPMRGVIHPQFAFVKKFRLLSALVGEKIVLDGTFQLTILKTLKNSALNWTAPLSPSFLRSVSLTSERFKLEKLGP